MLDTDCSPGNYISKEFYQSNTIILKEFLVPSIAERVDLATNNSAKQITEHIVMLTLTVQQGPSSYDLESLMDYALT